MAWKFLTNMDVVYIATLLFATFTITFHMHIA